MPVRRRHSVAFTVLVAVAMLLGAAVMAIVLVSVGAPDAIVLGVLLAAVPVGPLVASFMWLDRYEPEPRGLLLAGLGWGAFVATAVALVFQVVDAVVFGRPESVSAALVAPFTEEAAKGLFILLLLWFRRHEIDGVLDGVVYAGMVGIGFAFTENILYYAAAYVGDGTGPGGLEETTAVFVVRGIFSPFAHPFFTVFIGIGVGLACYTASRALRIVAPVVGYAVAVATHALWNGSVFYAEGAGFLITYVFLMVPAFFIVVGLALWVRRREGLMLTRSLGDCVRRGFVLPHEVPWLVRLPARYAARRHARQVGGKAAAETVAEFQATATELGFLHDRYLRNVAPADFAARGQELVDQLQALRPAVIWPGPTPTGVAQPLGGSAR
ncbi:PrsW family intramembrane metalloprotease [Nocardioides massiliensis]|uniref:RsiW-degrading membrane proteinase PrsW (M82 family) n=1 Tax=Nocardioides massiliensis TaxID=1325935 RepID=A0ABT9NPH3_9ACTN|nr:PrsW family intramembrane metalloprotease [Nocardioides massiliensis]MDP9822309.1 RsiW-degrading membrane proteinase PrsW (M82 family) [Nocardioides massiliensis]